MIDFCMSYLLPLMFGLSLAFVLLIIFIASFREIFLDLPNSRSSHLQAVPRGGGLVFLVVSMVSTLFFVVTSANTYFHSSFALVLGQCVALPLALVGLVDDFMGLPSTLRYSVQLVTSFLIILISPLVAPSVVLLPLLVLLVIAVTAVINFTNFMDGLDGLVAGCMAVAMTAAAIQLEAPWPIWALVGALLGFLLWNWSPAKVFMGDVGSTFLGAVFAVIVLQAASWSEALALLLVATPLLGDACICVLRRLMAGQQVFHAHRLHLFQRLHQAGWPHARVSSLYIAATAVLAIALLWGGLVWVIPLAAVELLIGIWLDQQVALPFAVASRG